MIKLSRGLQGNVLGYYGVRAMMNKGVIDIYSTPRPETPEAAPTGALLARITKNGEPFISNQGANGLVLTQRIDGSLADTGDWFLTGIRQGAATWWRWKWMNYDSDGDSLYYPRMDGDVGESLILPTRTITVGLKTKIDEFNLTFGVC